MSWKNPAVERTWGCRHCGYRNLWKHKWCDACWEPFQYATAPARAANAAHAAGHARATNGSADPWQDPQADPWQQWQPMTNARTKPMDAEYKEFLAWKANKEQNSKDPNQIALEARRNQLHSEMSFMDSIIHACH